MKKWLNKLFIFIACLLVCSWAQAFISVNLVYLSQSQQLMPGSNGDLFTQYRAPHLSGGYTLFYAKGVRGNFGLFTDYYGFLRSIANNLTQAPFGTGNFTSFDDFSDFNPPPDSYNQSLTNNTIAFVAIDRSWQTSLYNVVSQAPNLIANAQTPIPQGQGNFTGFAYPSALSNGAIAFWGSGANNQEGLYAANSKGLLNRLVDTTIFIPGTMLRFQHFSYPAFSRVQAGISNYAFVGVDSNNNQGLYLMKNGKIITIANQNTSIPGSSVGFFTTFKDVSYDGNTGNVAFVGAGILGQLGLYIYNGSKIIPALTSQEWLPDTKGQFSRFSMPNLLGENLIFHATGSQGSQGIYFYSLNGNLFKVVSNNDIVNGKHITNLEISHEAFSGNQVAIHITFADGSSGIYIATLRGVAY